MKYKHLLLHLFLLLLTAGVSLPAVSGEQVITLEKLRYDSPELQVRLRLLTPNQVASFYIGRGFPNEMIKRLRETCYITVGIHNRSKQVIWHDTSQWKFRTGKGALKRLDRNYWKQYWQKIHAPLPSQSIFRWTLLPDRLDFRPYEREGGNIILPRQGEPFTLDTVFTIGDVKHGRKLRLRFTHLRCAEDP